jgi:hypothetical protein
LFSDIDSFVRKTEPEYFCKQKFIFTHSTRRDDELWERWKSLANLKSLVAFSIKLRNDDEPTSG